MLFNTYSIYCLLGELPGISCHAKVPNASWKFRSSLVSERWKEETELIWLLVKAEIASFMAIILFSSSLNTQHQQWNSYQRLRQLERAEGRVDNRVFLYFIKAGQSEMASWRMVYSSDSHVSFITMTQHVGWFSHISVHITFCCVAMQCFSVILDWRRSSNAINILS